MGPTNVALVKLFRADQVLREAQGHLDSASRSVRVQERRVADTREKLQLAQSQLREQQTAASHLELEVKTHDEKIERLRGQQQTAKNLKEYQVFLVEINTEKIDKGKLEEQELRAMEEVEKLTAQVKELTTQLASEEQKLATMKTQLSGKLSELQAEVERVKAIRDEAASQVAPSVIGQYERLAERYEGDAMAALGKPNRRREEYVCTVCNMSLVTDIYNRLHSRDEPILCPNCRRMLFIPDDLPPEAAINSRPARKSYNNAAEEEAQVE